MSQNPVSPLRQFLVPHFCWNDLDKAARHDCITTNKSPQLELPNTFRRTLYGWDLAGKLRDFWHDSLVPLLKQYYRDYYDHIIRDVHWDGVVKCWMIGSDKSHAVPTVVIMCYDRGITKRYARLVAKDPCFHASAFDIRGLPDRIHFNADITGSDPTDLKLYPQTTALHPQEEIFYGPLGTKIHVLGQTATMGGYLDIDGRKFGLTVAHLFKDQPPPAASDEHNGELYDPLDDSDDEYDSGHEDIRPASSEWPLVGRVNVHATDGLSDAIGFTDFSVQANNISRNGLDWALINVSPAFNTSRQHNINQTGIGQSPIIVQGLIEKPPGGPVLLCTDSIAQKSGRISSTISLICLPSSREMEVAYSMDTPCERGDCGAWVIDPVIERAFGVIVAYSSFERFSYVVPLVDVLDRIGQAWQVVVKLAEDEPSAYETVKLAPSSMTTDPDVDLTLAMIGSHLGPKPGPLTTSQQLHQKSRSTNADKPLPPAQESATHWTCQSCGKARMSVALDTHCWNCGQSRW